VVRSEPYRLAADVWGIGFQTADTIAAAVAIARDSPERVRAGLAYTLSEAADDGHCYLPEPNLIGDAAKILEVPAELIGPCLDELAAAEGVVREDVPATVGPAGAEAGRRWRCRGRDPGPRQSGLPPCFARVRGRQVAAGEPVTAQRSNPAQRTGRRERRRPAGEQDAFPHGHLLVVGHLDRADHHPDSQP
jgi:hypothetical protein